MTNTNTLCTTDISHPSVDLIEVTVSTRGNFDAEKFREGLQDWCTTHKVPNITENSLGVALKRAMQELVVGSERDLKSLGRKGMTVYTLTTTDLSRADLEECDGRGIGSAEVSARIEVDQASDSYSVRVSPLDHPAAPQIKLSFDRHRGVYSGTYDVKPWLTRVVLPHLGAVLSSDCQGKYIVATKNGNVEALSSLQALFTQLVTGEEGRVRMYYMGRTSNDESIVDLLADCVDDEVRRTCAKIESRLEEGDSTLKRRSLASLAKKALVLRDRINGLTRAAGDAVADSMSYLASVEARIAAAELALSEKA